MTNNQPNRPALTPPSVKQQTAAANQKIERALEVRKSSSQARLGKALAFPSHRMYQA